MPDFYSRPVQPQTPDLRVAQSQNIASVQRTVVVGLRADATERVMQETIRQAVMYDAAVRVVLFSADDPTSPNFSGVSQVKEVAQTLIDAGLEFEIFRPDSDVGEQVLELAHQHHAELIVLSVHKRSPMLKMLLGSAAQHILLGAECPVLSLR